MNEIIKNIEAAQLKETVPSFNVGDTVRVSVSYTHLHPFDDSRRAAQPELFYQAVDFCDVHACALCDSCLLYTSRCV